MGLRGRRPRPLPHRLLISRTGRVLLHASGQPVVQVLLEELLSGQRGPQSQEAKGGHLKFWMYCDDFIQMTFSVSEYKANRQWRRLVSIRERDCDRCKRENT